MSKYRIIGIILALLLLIFALTAKTVGGEVAEGIILPLLAMMCAVLLVIEIVTYRKCKDEQEPTRLIVRMITLAVMEVLLTAAIIYKLVN
ncbi:MAG: hypothetical protein IJ428_01675 [Clostridia bacterium]|nr:hypothetical protein [Clostridia bacterium]